MPMYLYTCLVYPGSCYQLPDLSTELLAYTMNSSVCKSSQITIVGLPSEVYTLLLQLQSSWWNCYSVVSDIHAWVAIIYHKGDTVTIVVKQNEVWTSNWSSEPCLWEKWPLQISGPI